MRFFINGNQRSFLFLNVSQFLGALNDNIFKLLTVFLLINVRGIEHASSILSFAGAIFVIPYLLFSSAAGVMADRISKRKIIVTMKFAEMVIVLLSIVAIYFKSAIGLYTFLFLLSTHSAIFGPSKYGIIPEIVPKTKVSKANGLLTSLTMIAIIFGTFLASFLTDITNKNFLLCSSVCLIIALIGFWASLKIKKTPAQRSEKKIHPLFIYEIYQSLKFSLSIQNLFPSILGAGYFLFLGAFVQLNTIPFAIQSLHLSEVGGGYLFLFTAIGIASGALIAGKVAKDKIELGQSCFSGFALAILMIMTGYFPNNVYLSVFLLISLGVFGGLFLIPFEAFIQVYSPEAKRGQIIAATNFMSFVGVLMASFALYLLGNILNLSAAKGFIVLGFVTFAFNFINSGRLSDVFLQYFARKFFKHLYYMKTKKLPKENSLIILNEFSWKHALTLSTKIDNLKIITCGKKGRNFPFINGIFNSILMVSPSLFSVDKLKEIVEKDSQKSLTFCLLCRKKIKPSELKTKFLNYSLYIMKVKKHKRVKNILGFSIIKTIYQPSFEKING